MIRILAYACLVIIALLSPLWVFIIAAFGYASIFGWYELLILAILIDARFGEAARGFSYVYTALAALIILSIRFVRPRLQL